MRAGIFLGLFLASQAISADTTIQYLYVDSNVGDSSGGHSALRVGDFIYHYQYFPDRIFRIVRDDRAAFYRTYNQFENRTFDLNQLDVNAADSERIENHLTQLLLIQEKHARIQLEFQEDLDLLQAMRRGDTIHLEGSGFFAITEANSTAEPPLLFSADTGVELRALPRIPMPVPEVKIDSYPIAPLSFSSRYKAILQRSLGRTLLQDVRIRPWQSFISPNAFYETGKPVSDQDAIALQRYLASLRKRIPEMLRGESGASALLVAMARQAVIEKSLATRSWMLLDIFGPADPAIPFEATSPLLKELNVQSLLVFDQARLAFQKSDSDLESTYNLIENAAARWREIEGKGRTPGKIRLGQNRMIPRGSGKVQVPRRQVAEEFTVITEKNKRDHLNAMHSVFGYNLILRNCTTEILRELQASFPSKADASRALGGSVDPDGLVTFIPFISSYQVQNGLRIKKVERVYSRRRKGLETLYAKELDTVVYLRESNVLSSTLYRVRPRDTYFLLFTDDVLLPRPIYGLVNFTYGLGHTILGLGVLPLGTERLEAGAKGMLFSLPELIFFNIRKGSFDDLQGLQPVE